MLGLATILALIQPPRLETFGKTRGWVSRIANPIERRTPKRLPVLIADLNDVCAPDGGHVWVVGARGLILHSADRGRTWQRQFLDSTTRVAPLSRGAWVWPSVRAAEAVESAPSKSAEPTRPVRAIPQARVPDLHGLSVGEAYARAEKAGLRLATTPSAATEFSCVVAQSPAAGTAVLTGTFIEIQVGDCSTAGTGTQTNAPDSTTVNSEGSSQSDRKTNPETTPPVRTTVSVETADLVSVSFLNAESGAVWSADGIGYRTNDGGQTWRKADDLKLGAIRRVRETATRRWVVTANGALYGWTRERRGWSPARSTPRALDVAIAGDGPLILDRSSKVRSGQRVMLDGRGALRETTLIAIAAREAGSRAHLWALDNHSRVVFAGDSGRSRDVVPIRADSLRAIAFAPDARHGWVVGRGGTIKVSADGGKTWYAQTIDARWRLVMGSRDRKGRWRAKRGSGQILLTTDHGAHWTRQDTLEESAPRHWISEQDSAAFTRLSSAEAWGALRRSASAPVIVAQFDSAGRRGEALTAGFTILSTRDGGRTWKEHAPYQQFPAPWFYAVLAGAAWMAVRYAGSRRKGRTPEPGGEPRRGTATGIEQSFSSDQPVGLYGRDWLGFRDIALGISAFIRHEKTEPPFTIAVTGPWGSGKSSIMKMVRDDLDGRGLRSVWFNAWHNQKEGNLPSSLLERIRRECVPSPWSLKGFVVRGKLFFRRLGEARAWLIGFLLTLVVAAVVGVFGSEDTEKSAGKIARWVTNGVKSLDVLPSLIGLDQKPASGRDATGKEAAEATAGGQGKQPTNKAEGAAQALTSLAFWVTVIGSIRKLMLSMQAFGVRPEAIATGVTSFLGIKSNVSAADVRQRFAKDFGEVVEALRPDPVVIFIDDLDRCRPENVLDTLETLNYLYTNGRCFIVMGMDRQWVEGCVAHTMKDVAEELGPTLRQENGSLGRRGVAEAIARAAADTKTEPASQSWQFRQMIAGFYLEKLINIEVQVPRPTPKQYEAMMKDTAEHERRLTPEQEFWLSLDKLVGPTVRAAGLALFSFLALFVAGQVTKWCDDNPGMPQPVQFQAAGIAIPLPPSNPPAVVSPPATPSISSGQVLFAAPHMRPRRFESALLIILGGALTVFAVRWGLRRMHWNNPFKDLSKLLSIPESTPKDTPRFSQAMSIWSGVIHARDPAPRPAKRFKNRVRFFAMRERRHELPVSWRDRMLRAAIVASQRLRNDKSPLPWTVEENGTPKSSMDEALLVGLATLEYIDPDWVSDNQQWGRLAQGSLPKLASGGGGDLEEAVGRALAEQSGLVWPPSSADRDRFLELARGIRSEQRA
ncbi:MAG TPA: P-loop NTPase fold protein [Candidatus Eisenbacteria bacterium]|nr:P-loop NTPase fold protein [Candidatus Eisenbacteria bacterium]